MTSKNRVISNAINAQTAKNATARNGQLSGYIANAIEKMKDAAKLQSSEDWDGTVDAARIAQTFIEKAVDGGRRKFRSEPEKWSDLINGIDQARRSVGDIVFWPMGRSAKMAIRYLREAKSVFDSYNA